MKEKRVVVIAGPSGSGKNTIINRLLKRIPDSTRTVTATTRLPRPGEKDGDDYYFFDMDRFDKEVGLGHIVGQRFVPLSGGIHYGLYLPDLQKRLMRYHTIFAPVDVTGAEYLKEEYGALTIFIVPEAFSEYRLRIRSRSPEMSEHEFDMRMKIADEELRVHSPKYDYRIVNAGGMLDQSVDEAVEIIEKEGYTR
jgi:guanylate kinase